MMGVIKWRSDASGIKRKLSPSQKAILEADVGRESAVPLGRWPRSGAIARLPTATTTGSARHCFRPKEEQGPTGSGLPAEASRAINDAVIQEVPPAAIPARQYCSMSVRVKSEMTEWEEGMGNNNGLDYDDVLVKPEEGTQIGGADIAKSLVMPWTLSNNNDGATTGVKLETHDEVGSKDDSCRELDHRHLRMKGVKYSGTRRW